MMPSHHRAESRTVSAWVSQASVSSGRTWRTWRCTRQSKDSMMIRAPAPAASITARGGNTRAVDGRLFGKQRRGPAAGAQAANIEMLQVCISERADQRALPVEPRAGGIARQVWVECGIMADDDDSVGGQAYVQFEGGDTQGGGGQEPFQRVFREQGSGAAVALHVYGSGHLPSGRTKANPTK
jgi:hypothetical protein